MRKIFLWLLCSMSLLYPDDSSVCLGIQNQDTPIILVSIPPYKKIVQELIQDEASVQSIIPAKVSFHTYEPRPKDIETTFSSSLWFYIGDPFEEKIIQIVLDRKKTLKRIDLRENLSLLSQSCCHKGTDPHIWLSPRLMKKQISTIAIALKEYFPKKAQEIEERHKKLIEKIDRLIIDVDTLLLPMKGKAILVSHGAYAYLCHDYGITQLSLEKEGKEPSLASFSNLLQEAKTLHMKKIFSIKPYPKVAIERVASILGASLLELDPYSEDYFENMQITAKEFNEAMNEEFTD